MRKPATCCTPVLVCRLFKALIKCITGLMALHSQVQYNQTTTRRVLAAQLLQTEQQCRRQQLL
jgi:hypothetical protein